ncbi:hypothetical protein ELY33_08600 [Vreelandella andesensis]|uniref:Uncharacterized protein n=1 Tax=Vreelandella andesensis TaxID=447567 RepID=A0A433KMR0_9GAMM|nr:hypothetical protein [Halomonas andesensis]RUR30861.1 hypothetical protein ELY33_08600 [Halomonas andesensis]
MHYRDADLTLHELIYSVIPNLNSAEKLVLNTSESLIEAAENPLDAFKRNEQKHAFSLEVHRIRINIEHLLERYRADVDSILRASGEVKGPVVEPDAQEADAIRSAIDIYLHVRSFQRGERRQPIPGRS